MSQQVEMTNAFSDYLFLVQFGPAILKSVAVLAIDIADPFMRILFASDLTCEMLGYEPGELTGKELDMILRPEDRAIHHTHFAVYQAHPSVRTMNEGVWVDGVKKDGSQIKIQVSLCPQPVGKTDCVIACIADVTNAYKRYQPQAFQHGDKKGL